MLTRRRAVILVLVGAAGVKSSSQATDIDATSAGSKPHFVTVLQDDMGANDVGFMTEHLGPVSREASKDVYSKTPMLHQLAGEGIVLLRHYAHWQCSPSRRAFLTGRLPLHHTEELSGMTDDIDLRWNTLAHKLSAAGYICHWFGKGHTGYKSYNHLPQGLGFNGNVSMFLGGTASYYAKERWTGSTPQPNADYSTAHFGSLAVAAVRDHPDPKTPMFLYLPWQAVHAPYEDLPPDLVSTLDQNGFGSCPTVQKHPDSCTYYYMLAAADMYVSQIHDALVKNKMWANTLFLFTSDNGGVRLGKNGINYPLRGFKQTNWEGGVRTAAFISGGFVPTHLAGTTNKMVISITDWYPTLCKLAGVSEKDDPQVSPRSPFDIEGDVSSPGEKKGQGANAAADGSIGDPSNASALAPTGRSRTWRELELQFDIAGDDVSLRASAVSKGDALVLKGRWKDTHDTWKQKKARKERREKQHKQRHGQEDDGISSSSSSGSEDAGGDVSIDDVYGTDDIYGEESFPGIDGVDIWPMLMEPKHQGITAAHKALWISDGVIVSGKWKLVMGQPEAAYLGTDEITNVRHNDPTFISCWADADGVFQLEAIPAVVTARNLTTEEVDAGDATNATCRCCSRGFDGGSCLFNVEDDPAETIDLSEVYSTVASKLTQMAIYSRRFAYQSRSSPALLGHCSTKCATDWLKTFGYSSGPHCGVPGCSELSDAARADSSSTRALQPASRP